MKRNDIITKNIPTKYQGLFLPILKSNLSIKAPYTGVITASAIYPLRSVAPAYVPALFGSIGYNSTKK